MDISKLSLSQKNKLIKTLSVLIDSLELQSSNRIQVKLVSWANFEKEDLDRETVLSHLSYLNEGNGLYDLPKDGLVRLDYFLALGKANEKLSESSWNLSLQSREEELNSLADFERERFKEQSNTYLRIAILKRDTITQLKSIYQVLSESLSFLEKSGLKLNLETYEIQYKDNSPFQASNTNPISLLKMLLTTNGVVTYSEIMKKLNLTHPGGNSGRSCDPVRTALLNILVEVFNSEKFAKSAIKTIKGKGYTLNLPE